MFASLSALAEERRRLDAREAAWLGKVAAYERSDDWRADGYASAANALRHACRMTPGAARGHVEVARKLEELPVVAGAFGEGEISRAHVRVIANAHTPERAAELAAVEAPLVDAARTVNAHELLGIVRHLTDAIDIDAGVANDEAVHARRRYHLSRTIDGLLATDGLFDPEAAAIHEAAITAELERDFHQGDGRTLAQRRADAVTNLFRRSLDRGDVGTARKVAPHVTVVVDLDDLPGAAPGLVRELRVDARRNGRLSATALERLTCDCNISRVITAGRSEILDVGRSARTVSSAQWKALVVRDRRCCAPGCDRPPDQCEAHHVVHWSRGGPTDLENLELLCRYHHRHRHADAARARAA